MRGDLTGDFSDFAATLQQLCQGVGELLKAAQDALAIGVLQAEQVGEVECEQKAGDYLRVESFSGCHAHLHISPIGCVEDGIGAVGEVAVATVHDGYDGRASGFSQIHRAVRVGGGARLADGNDEMVGHVVVHSEPRQLRCHHRHDRRRVVLELVSASCHERLGRNSRCTLADSHDFGDLAAADALCQVFS